MSKQLKRKSYRLIMAQVLSLTLVASPACNRVTPEKETGKTSAGEVGGTLANKPTTTEEAVLPGTLTNTPDNSERGPLTSTNEGAAVPISANNPAPRVGGPPPPGIEIEAVPGGSDSETAPTGDLSQRLGDRSFVKLELPNAALAPDQLLAFLADSDRAVHDLTIAWNAKQLSEKEYLEQAKRLSLLKMQASERLYNDKSATQAQQKTAIAAQVESLSQLTGLGDVSAAQKLLTLAGELTKSPDTHLAHQGRLVLLGFRLNQLVEGQIKDPQVVLEDVNALLDKSEYRGAVELLALQQGLGVLGQLGYAEQAQQVQQRIVKEFRASPDRELAMRAWSIEVGSSPELKAAIDEIKKTLAGEEQDATKVATAAAEFIRKFPTLNTVYFFLQAIVDLEYRGFTTASRELSKTVVAYKTQVPTSPLMDEVDIVLEGHNKRLGLLNQSLVLEELWGMDGKPFDWGSYRGKVVLVYFWTVDVPSLDMIQQIQQLRQRITDPNLDIVGICTDDGRTIGNAEQMVQRQAWTWRNVRSNNPQALGLKSKAAQMAGVNFYPHFAMLVDKQGKVRAVHPNFTNVDGMINDLLKEK